MSIRFEADDLRGAALERVNTARRMFDATAVGASDLSACIYLAGVAVECILRAYRMKRHPEFSSRHDLAELLKASGLVDFVPEKRKREVSVALGDVWARWKNEYRYASDQRLLSDLKRRGLTEGIKGDQLKESARIVLARALELINVGEATWKTA
jgi:hypothetical protein